MDVGDIVAILLMFAFWFILPNTKKKKRDIHAPQNKGESQFSKKVNFTASSPDTQHSKPESRTLPGDLSDLLSGSSQIKDDVFEQEDDQESFTSLDRELAQLEKELKQMEEEDPSLIEDDLEEVKTKKVVRRSWEVDRAEMEMPKVPTVDDVPNEINHEEDYYSIDAHLRERPSKAKLLLFSQSSMREKVLMHEIFSTPKGLKELDNERD
ncbi:MAG: hypothetical protein L7U87_08710 [Chlamydiales bacterium]|nr:hypothetical protein [Chlamydiales bacterium]